MPTVSCWVRLSRYALFVLRYYFRDIYSRYKLPLCVITPGLQVLTHKHMETRTLRLPVVSCPKHIYLPVRIVNARNLPNEPLDILPSQILGFSLRWFALLVSCATSWG